MPLKGKPDGQLIGSTLLAVKLSVTKATLYNWVRDLKFPKPITLGGHYRWRVREVDIWVAARAKAADARLQDAADPKDITEMALRSLDHSRGGRGQKKDKPPPRPRGRPRRDRQGMST